MPHITNSELRDEIVRTFNQGDLQIVVVDLRNTDLSNIVTLPAPFQNVVAEVVLRSRQEGWLSQLLIELKKRRPGNVEFQQFIDEYVQQKGEDINQPPGLIESIFEYALERRRYVWGIAAGVAVTCIAIAVLTYFEDITVKTVDEAHNPVEVVEVSYLGRKGKRYIAEREPGTNEFKIPLRNLEFANPRIDVEFSRSGPVELTLGGAGVGSGRNLEIRHVQFWTPGFVFWAGRTISLNLKLNRR